MIEELLKLTDEELNVRLAECVGYTDITFCPLMGFHQQKSDEKSKECGGRWRFAIPRYCSDLNAVAEVEGDLASSQINAYLEYLFTPSTGFQDVWTITAARRAVHASARQRTIALIATLSKGDR